MQSVGLIGVGNMGRWMALHLLKNKQTVWIYDKNQEAVDRLVRQGANLAASVTDLAERCSTVILMLPNSTIVESVVLGKEGIPHSMAAGGTIIDMGSSYALSTIQLAQQAKEKQIQLYDAPVSGGVKGAREANLTIMVGADEEGFEEIRPLLTILGKTIKRVGEVGAGHALKAINNFLSAATLYATTEAMILAKKLGIELQTALETINESSGRSYSTDYKFPTFILPRNFNSGFSLELLLKDIRMVTSMAKDTHVPTFLASMIEQIYEAAKNAGDESQDHTEIVKFLESNTQLNLSLKEDEHE